MQYIDNGAFWKCTNLKTITLSKNLKTVGPIAFANCSKLSNIRLPDTITIIGSGAFERCVMLKEIEIPYNVKEITTDVFSGCVNLQNITIPANVKKICGVGYGSAFASCYNLHFLCYNNTYALEFAKENNISYEIIEDKSHVYSSEHTIMPTCTKAGKDTYTCLKCGHSYTKSVAMTAHKYTSKVIAPTYTAQGYTLHTCSVCGKSYKDSYKAKLARTSIAKAKISGVKNKEYQSYGVTQSPTVKLGSKTLSPWSDYTVTYKNNKKVGTATMVITGKGAYKGSISKTFKITPAKPVLYGISSPKAKQLKVSLYPSTSSIFDGVYKEMLKIQGADAVQIVYSTSSKFTKTTTKTASTKKSYKVISGLTKGKTYYIKIRTYKTVNGTKYYSRYSGVKKIKVK